MPPPRCWRMLTGVGYRAGSLTPDQIARVQHQEAIDAGMRSIKGDPVGEWVTTTNGAAVLLEQRVRPAAYNSRLAWFGRANH